MLEAIRERAQGLIAKIILALIIVPFALWGVDSYFTGGGKEAAVATVDGVDITQRAFVEALTNQKESMEAGMRGAKVDMDNKAFRQEVLDQLINSELLYQAARDTGIRVTPEQLTATLQTIPAFQEDGVYSEARLEAWLRNRNMSRNRLMELLEHDMVLQQLQFGYVTGGVVAKPAASQFAAVLAEQREVSESIFDAKDYQAGIQVDDKAVEADYTANRAAYSIPERVQVDYLVLSADALQAQVQISDQQAREFYEANKTRYQEPEQRRASHILVKTDAKMSEADRATARSKAEGLLKTLQDKPAQFAELARQNSDDTVSAQRGGDLGSFTRELMVKPFSDAVFAMKPGEIRGLVETQFGFHIIRLDTIIPGTQMGFAVVKPEIVDELTRQEAQRRFAEAAERFSNLVYEKPENLAPAAQAFNLTVAHSDWISRGQAAPAFLNHPRLTEAVFSPEAIAKQQNTEAIDVGSDMLVAARVTAHQPEGTKPLSEVTEEIRAKLMQQAARAKAIAAGQAALAAAQAGKPVSGLAPARSLSRMVPMGLPPQAVREVFKLSASAVPGFVGLETAEGYRLYKVSKVSAEAPPEGQVSMIRNELGQIVAKEELRAFLEYRRAHAKIKINQSVLEKRAE